MSYDLSKLGQAARQFWVENIRGPLPRRLVIIIPDGIDKEEGIVTVPYLHGTCSMDSPDDDAPDGEPRPERHGTGIHPCTKHILAALRQSSRPLTKTRLLEEMARLGYDWSERTVDRYLKVLMDDGTIENPKGAKPPGYRLTDPDSPAMDDN